MVTTIKTTIEQYINCISHKNTDGLDKLLSPHFRVIQVISDTFNTVNLDRSEYLQLFAENKAGGDNYHIENLTIQYIGPTAVASYTLHGKQTQMHVFLQLVQSTAAAWTIISNTPVVTACPH